MTRSTTSPRSSRSPLSPSTSGAAPASSRLDANVRPSPVGPHPIVVVGMPPDVKNTWLDAARAHGVGVVDARHLHAACVAVGTKECAAVVAWEGLRPWDRAVLVEHVARARMALHWVGPRDAHDADRALETLLLRAQRSRA